MSDRNFGAAPEGGAGPAEAEVSAREKVYVPPGGFSIARMPSALSTILGSCVSVCLWDEAARIGGMNHFLLPHWTEGGGASWRYGNAAIDGLIEALLASGARRANLKAKVFGGARVLAVFAGNGGSAGHLGARNVEVALETLERRGLPVVAQATGGERGRKLVFHTDDGSAWVKLL